jgi:hypothetical protein
MVREYTELNSLSFSPLSARKRKYPSRVTDELKGTENVISYPDFYIAFFSMPPIGKFLSVFQRHVSPISP